MKSYSHLYEKMIDAGVIKLAIKRSSKGRKKKRNRRILWISEHPDEMVEHYRLFAVGYYAKPRPAKEIYDGISKKIRKVTVPTFDEQVLMNMIIIVLEPIIMKELYYHVHGSIPGRGCHKAKKQIEKWIRKDKKGTKYFYKYDIRKFFDSISHPFIKYFLERKIKDAKFLRLLYQIIDNTNIGLPLGFPTSHWLAHWYIADIDRKVVSIYHPAHYVRYVDDVVIFDSSKRKLHRIHRFLNKALLHHLLIMKGNYQICKLKGFSGRALDFMGFKFYTNRVILRKSIMVRITRMARKLFIKQLTIYDCRRTISALSYIKSSNVYEMYTEKIKPYVNIGDCKSYISIYDRRNVA